ncbi:hypothetical protein ACFQV2_00290 [Actinokineospora soli]|uniref:Type IV secretory system conjugative DNA transfer VirD4/TraG family protein n=1 Tax=Actinokineospora soli TaxID=1048753 RepID=A0ABW2TGW3_9PSEU
MNADRVFGACLAGGALGAGGWLVMSVPELGKLSLLGPWAVVAGAVLFAGSLALWAKRPGGVPLTLSLLAVAAGVFLDTDVVPEETPGREATGWLLFSGITGAVMFSAWVWYGRRGSSQVVNRWSSKARRNDGVATGWAILRAASWFAVRRRAAVVRPSVREMSWWRRWRTPLREFATPVARVGIFRIWSLVEDVTLRLGGPRTGKTGELACRILDAPGAVIATSTRTDLIDVTGPVRAQRGPVHVFNPGGVGGLASTITFDPLSGCENPTVATSRAADLLSGVSGPGAGGDREFWMAQGRRVLAALMYAAALGGARCATSWRGWPTRPAPRARCRGTCAARTTRRGSPTPSSSSTPTTARSPRSAPRSCPPSGG